MKFFKQTNGVSNGSPGERGYSMKRPMMVFFLGILAVLSIAAMVHASDCAFGIGKG